MQLQVSNLPGTAGSDSQPLKRQAPTETDFPRNNLLSFKTHAESEHQWQQSG